MAESNNQMDVDDPDSESELAIESENDLTSNSNSMMIRDKGFSLQAVGILNSSPVDSSIINDDGVDFDDDKAEDDIEKVANAYDARGQTSCGNTWKFYKSVSGRS